jgi:hypothetical protein
MKHVSISGVWRPFRAHHVRDRRSLGVLSALAFNLCLLLLPLATGMALAVISRDHLYTYEYSEAGARVLRERIARLNAELIPMDFDRQRQWDSLIALELRSGDPSAARGFLLSGGAMLPQRSGGVLVQAGNSDATDAELEVAALELLTPNTRALYQESVELLSRRNPNAPSQAVPSLADRRDFELMARALIEQPETDPLQFILVGFSLDLAGELTPQMQQGAVVLLASSRRDDFPSSLRDEWLQLLDAAAPVEQFRQAALQTNGDAGAYANVSEAFRAVVNNERAGRARHLLEQLGAMGEATNTEAAATMLTHAASLGDVPRLTLIALAAGDRAAAASKRLPRDGRLLDAARGELRLSAQLVAAIAGIVLSLIGLVAVVAFRVIEALRERFSPHDVLEDEYGHELIDLSTRTWHPL